MTRKRMRGPRFGMHRRFHFLECGDASPLSLAAEPPSLSAHRVTGKRYDPIRKSQ